MLPFLNKAPILEVREYRGEKIFNPLSIPAHDYGFPALPAYYVKPLDIAILSGSPEEIANTLAKQPTKVIVVDYEIVADIINVENGVAYYPTPNGYIAENTEFESLVTLASNGSKLELTEALLEDISRLKALKKSKVQVSQTQSPIYQRLEDYLKAGYVTQRTLLLIGQSGVSKSALVKSIADKLGFRVQDMRLAYSSRLDIQGLTEITYENGLPLSSESPSDELIKCTDEYINYCRNALPIIKERAQELKKQGAPEYQIQQLREIYKQYQYYAKPPILFLDECNRTEASVRQAFTNILTDKAFMGHEMKIARVVAAANAPIGASDELADIFLTNNSDDAAFNDRWEAIPVTPEDNLESWKNWAEGTKSNGLRNICEEVTEFLERHPKEYYNMEDVVATYQDTYDETQTATTPYPSYRTWEFVSNYLQASEDKTFLQRTIDGLIGPRVGALFTEFLNSKGWSAKPVDEENVFPDFIEEGIKTGTPVMLLTPSGTAKTSTINQVVRKLGYKKITINLAECDRTDLIGAPAKVETSVMVAGEVEGVDKQLAQVLKDKVKDFNLPATVTMKAPKASLVYEFDQAVRDKQQILLVFEEANRVNNPAVMGALLQVISDHILFGVKFDPKYVKVICTANIGDNYGDTRGMD